MRDNRRERPILREGMKAKQQSIESLMIENQITIMEAQKLILQMTSTSGMGLKPIDRLIKQIEKSKLRNAGLNPSRSETVS